MNPLMQPRHITPDVSDEDRGVSPAGSNRASRRRSTRACDQCRRTKSKCERSDLDNVCRACAAMGVSCTFAGPSHKRGPPKGYILALERRLHQVEALLGTVISSDDPRARGLVNDLSRDQLAAHIIRRVKVGPFGPRGRLQQPFGSTKEDFLAAIMTGPGDDSPSRYGEDNYALVSPDRDWQDRLQALLNKPANVQYSNAPAASAQYALPSFRQLNSPAPAQQQQQYQQPSPSHTHHPQIQTANLSVPYSAKLESSSPVPNSSMLAPIHQSYQQQSAQPQGPYSQRLSWDGFNGYQRMGDTGSDDGDHSAKGRYELGPSDPGMPMGARDYQLQRCQDNTSDSSPRWYYNQQAVG